MKALNNTFFVTHFAGDETNAPVSAFLQSYRNEYQTEPDMYAALAYDSVLLIADAIKRAGRAEPVSIRDELKKTRNFSAVTGQINLSEANQPARSAVIIELKDGKQVFREKINP